jgi:hypothetical protein
MRIRTSRTRTTGMSIDGEKSQAIFPRYQSV